MRSTIIAIAFVALTCLTTGCQCGPGGLLGGSGGCCSDGCNTTPGRFGGTPGGILSNIHGHNVRGGQSHHGAAPGHPHPRADRRDPLPDPRGPGARPLDPRRTLRAADLGLEIDLEVGRL